MGRKIFFLFLSLFVLFSSYLNAASSSNNISLVNKRKRDSVEQESRVNKQPRLDATNVAPFGPARLYFDNTGITRKEVNPQSAQRKTFSNATVGIISFDDLFVTPKPGSLAEKIDYSVLRAYMRGRTFVKKSFGVVCDKCGYACRKKDMIFHCLSELPELVNGLSCKLCGVAFGSRSRIETHLKEEHKLTGLNSFKQPSVRAAEPVRLPVQSSTPKPQSVSVEQPRPKAVPQLNPLPRPVINPISSIPPPTQSLTTVSKTTSLPVSQYQTANARTTQTFNFQPSLQRQSDIPLQPIFPQPQTKQIVPPPTQIPISRSAHIPNYQPQQSLSFQPHFSLFPQNIVSLSSAISQDNGGRSPQTLMNPTASTIALAPSANPLDPIGHYYVSTSQPTLMPQTTNSTSAIVFNQSEIAVEPKSKDITVLETATEKHEPMISAAGTAGTVADDERVPFSSLVSYTYEGSLSSKLDFSTLYSYMKDRKFTKIGGLYQCENCGYRSRARSMIIHCISELPKGVHGISCKVCSETFRCRRSAEKHVKAEHNIQGTKTAAGSGKIKKIAIDEPNQKPPVMSLTTNSISSNFSNKFVVNDQSKVSSSNSIPVESSPLPPSPSNPVYNIPKSRSALHDSATSDQLPVNYISQDMEPVYRDNVPLLPTISEPKALDLQEPSTVVHKESDELNNFDLTSDYLNSSQQYFINLFDINDDLTMKNDFEYAIKEPEDHLPQIEVVPSAEIKELTFEEMEDILRDSENAILDLNETFLL